MLPVIGFPDDFIGDVHRALSDSSSALEKCHASCERTDGKFKEQFQKWFGSPTEGNDPSVNLLKWTVEQMKNRLNEKHENLAVVYSTDYDVIGDDYGNTLSMANRLVHAGKPDRKPMDLREKIDSYYGAGKKAELLLGPRFLLLERTAERDPSQLSVLLHELSHWAAGTRDLKNFGRDEPANGRTAQKCYGVSEGVPWATERGKYSNGVIKAVQNADSVAYFVASYFVPQ